MPGSLSGDRTGFVNQRSNPTAVRVCYPAPKFMSQKTYISLDAVGVPTGSAVGKATVEVLHVVKPTIPKLDPKKLKPVRKVKK